MHARKLIALWLVSPALIVAVGVVVKPLVLVALVTVLSFVVFGVPVAHLARTAVRRAVPSGAFSWGQVVATAGFVCLATSLSVAVGKHYVAVGGHLEPDTSLSAAIPLATLLAAVLTAGATFAADVAVTLVARMSGNQRAPDVR